MAIKAAWRENMRGLIEVTIGEFFTIENYTATDVTKDSSFSFD